jgi:large conductance mechanosensitive channel
MSMMKEFKAFVLRGNVMELAIAVIIGAAFGRIVTSLVNDILMPPLGLVLGGVDFKDLVIILKEATAEAQAVTINYGMFIQNLIDFLLIALVIFMMIQAFNSFKRKEKEAPTVEPVPTKDQELLAEIRDLLKRRV